MPATKRALLIGSSYNGLPGTENDVEAIASVLERYEFDVNNPAYVTKLCLENATCERIRKAWDKLESDIAADDVVVIYYSGHGGLAESKKADKNLKQPSRIQFLVPTDFDGTLKTWKGILDAEISQRLLNITETTSNVTYILDCCHSSRLGRSPRNSTGPSMAWSKVSTFDYNKTWEHMKELKGHRKLLEDNLWSNPNVVRIAAAADVAAAWQYGNEDNAVGIMTEQLVHVMEHTGIMTEHLPPEMKDVNMTEQLDLLMKEPNSPLSWRNIMLAVKELMRWKFPESKEIQEPRSAGADTRLPFSLERRAFKALLAKIGNKQTLIQGGRVHGVHKEDLYLLIPLNAGFSGERTEKPTTLTTTLAKIEKIHGFTSVAQISEKEFPSTIALAIPFQRRHRWRIHSPSHLQVIKEMLDGSQFFEPCETSEESIVEFRQEDNDIVLYGGGVRLGPRQLNIHSNIERLFSVAHMFSQAQDILSIKEGSGDGDETFRPNIEIEIGVVSKSKEQSLASYSTEQEKRPGSIDLTSDAMYYIRIKNDSKNKKSIFFVSVFRVNAAGKIMHLSSPWEMGVDLSYEAPLRLLARREEDLEGLPMEWPWPESVPREGRVKEHFVFVTTKEAVDLRALETSSPEAYLIARGEEQDLSASGRTLTPYHVTRIPYFLHWSEKVPEDKFDHQQIAAGKLPTPEKTEAGKNLASSLEGTVARGYGGALVRSFKRIPPLVWVINQHDEDITVVVSKYKPIRLPTALGFNVSSTGLGFYFNSTTFDSKATTKTLAPQSTAAFPFWTRKDGFGVISIFKGPDKISYIENDLVPIGVTVCFRNTPDLTILGIDSPTATGRTSPITQTVEEKVAVTFNQLVSTISGQTIKIVGDIDILGRWNPYNGVTLSAFQYTSGDPLWSATIALKAGQVIEYKYVKVQTNGSLQWEADPNRTYIVPSSGAKLVTKSDSWQY